MILIGHICLGAAIALSVSVLAAGVLAARRPERAGLARRLAALLPIPWLAAEGVLLWALWFRDDRLQYVVEHVDPTLPGHYRVAALWAGQEGSLLSLTVLLSLVGAGLALTLRGLTRRSIAIVLAVVAGVVLSMGLILVAGAEPFRAAPDHAELIGAGQQLRHWAMLIHPPMILCGYALCAAPFAIAAGTALRRRRPSRWVNAMRPWAYAAWSVLGSGIVLGAWWAYTQLGWGGYWAWDPVENASLLPWLTVTALIHSIAVCRARGVLAAWTCALALFTFVMCMFGTFITRGGMVQSVHSFGPSTLGVYLGVVLTVLTLGAAALLLLRAKRLRSAASSPELHDGEWLTLGGTLLLSFAAAAVLLGTAIPMVATLVLSTPASVTRNFYETTIGPTAVIAAALLAISPALATRRWSPARLRDTVALPAAIAGSVVLVAAISGLRSPAMLVFLWACITGVGVTGLALIRASREHARATGLGRARSLARVLSASPRLHGGRLAHIGVCVLLCGVCASSVLASTWDLTLRPGESRSLGSWRITLERVAPEDSEGSMCVRADITLAESGGATYTLSPRRRHYDHAEEPVGEVAIRSTLIRDVYAGLGSWDDANDAAVLHVRVLPGVMWIWIGASMGLVGGLMCVVPARRRVLSVAASEPIGPAEPAPQATPREALAIWKTQP